MNNANAQIPVIWIGTEVEFNSLGENNLNPYIMYFIVEPVLEEVQFIERNTGEQIMLTKQYAGEIIKLLKDTASANEEYYKFVYYRNYTKEGNQPLLISDVVPTGGATYYVDRLSVDVSRLYDDILLTSSSQTVQRTIDIISNVPLYFSVNTLGSYSVSIEHIHENNTSGKITYDCGLRICDIEYTPGQISYLNAQLIFYTDQNKKNKLGDCQVNIKVIHEYDAPVDEDLIFSSYGLSSGPHPFNGAGYIPVTSLMDIYINKTKLQMEDLGGFYIYYFNNSSNHICLIIIEYLSEDPGYPGHTGGCYIDVVDTDLDYASTTIPSDWLVEIKFMS